MKKNWLAFLFIFITMLLLAGCAAPEAEEGTSPSPTGMVPVATWESTGNPMQQTVRLMGDVLYYEVIEKGEDSDALRTTIFKRAGTEGEPWELLSLENVEVLWYQADEEGALYVLYQREDGEGVRYVLSSYNQQGGLIYEQQAGSAGEDMEALSMVLHGEVTASGEVCLASCTGDIYLYSAEGQLLASCRADWDKDTYQGASCGLVNAGGQGIYVYQVLGEQEISLRQVLFEQGSLGDAVALEVGEQKVASPAGYPGNNTQPNAASLPIGMELFNGYAMGILISDEEGLWQCQPGEETVKLLFSWDDNRVNLKNHTIDAIGVLADGEFYIMARRAYNNVSFVRVGYRDAQEIPDKQTVILGAVGTSEILREELGKMTSEFNQLSERYLIELCYYDSQDALYKELLRRQGPDIIHLGAADPAVLADKGVLEDLAPYFAGSAAVGEDDLLPAIRKAGTLRGKLCVVIPAYQIGGLMVEKGTVEGEGWTAEDFITLAEENPDSLLLDNGANVYRNMILNMAIEADLERYVNWQEGHCYFDGEEFTALLERIRQLPVPPREKIDPLSPDYFEADWKRFTDREYLVKELSVIGINSTRDEIVYNGGFVGGVYADMTGYPNRDAVPAYDMYVRNPYGINSASGVKEGAWAFMEYLLSAEYQNAMTTFPARKDSFDAYMKKDVIMGASVELSDEDRAFLRYMVENAYWARNVSCTDIRIIINEETAPLWAGDCSVETAAANIQNRVSLYLSE